MSKDHSPVCGCIDCLMKIIHQEGQIIQFTRYQDLNTTGANMAHPAEDRRATLREAFEAQIAALLETAGLEGDPAPPELPPPPAEQTDTYTYLFATARRNCRHDRSVTELLWKREYVCDDCQRHLWGDHRIGYRF